MLKLLSIQTLPQDAIKFNDVKSERELYTMLNKAVQTVPTLNGLSSEISLDLSKVRKQHHKKAIIAFVCRRMYTFTKYHTNHDIKKDTIIQIFGGLDEAIQTKQKRIWATSDLINEPSNTATPDYMCKMAKRIFKNDKNTKVTVLDHKAIVREGLRLIDAVGKPSAKKPRLLVMEYKGSANAPVICICGKGVIFDAGGVNLKTQLGSEFWSMKGDKTGGCIIIGIMKYLSETRSPVNVVGVVPFVENIISGGASNPGDIVKSHKGLTVEISNTDAEGRLILADAFSYCSRFKPKYLLDFATLTNWAKTMHCETSAIFFSTDPKIHTMIEELSETTGERMWGMPKWLDSMEFCKSKVADLINHNFVVDGECNEGIGFMATMFLAHFVPCDLKNWIHFDITNGKRKHMLYGNAMNTGIELIQRLSNSSSSCK